MGLNLTGGAAAIGNTSLVPLHRLSPDNAVIWAKCEFLNPSGSVKDRTAQGCLKHGIDAGEFSPGQPIVEMTSGNMGAGLAMLCSTLGYDFTAFMSEGSSPQRAQQMRRYGARVELVPQVTGHPGAVTGEDVTRAAEEAAAWALAHGAYFVDQFNNPGCMAIHEATTGPEIAIQMNAPLTAFLASLGTGGTFMGTARALKKAFPNMEAVAVHAAVLSGETPSDPPAHIIQGTGYGLLSPHFDHHLVDQEFYVTDEMVTAYQKRLMEEEGLLVGYSSAANVCAAVQYCKAAKTEGSPIHVATILCDTAFKYGL